MSDHAEMEAAIEAILFVSSEPVPRARLIELFEEDEREQAAAALAAVLARYQGGEGRGVMVEDVAGGVRLVTRPEMGPWLRRFFEVAGGSKLSMAALETLAIVAYRQPITGPEIQELRGVSPVGVLRTLLERRLVRIAGRKEVVGKPFLYATTREFLVHFGLNSLRDLPPLEEFEETFGAAAGSGPAAAGAGPGGAPGAFLESAAAEGAGGGHAGPHAVTGGPAGEDEEDREERILREAAAIAEREAADEAPGGAAREALGEARSEALGEAGSEASGEARSEALDESLAPAAEEETATGWEEAVEEDFAEGAGDRARAR
jgi:segregation and condensation protein B